jgi:hypothetical protein
MTIRALAVLLSLVSGCGAFADMHADHSGGQRTAPPPPRVRLVETRLARHPTDRQLAAHYCTEVAAGSHLGPAGVAACRALGPAPSDADLQFRFEVELEVTNPSAVRVPLVAALIAFTAFPDAQDAASLGAVCLELCASADGCPQRDDATACQSEDPAITDLASLGEATAGFVTSVALGEERFEDLGVQSISPHGTVRFVAELAVDPERMLVLIEQTNESAVAEARQGHAPELVIPYAIDGTVWVDAQGFGRIAASFPRATGTWSLAAAD